MFSIFFFKNTLWSLKRLCLNNNCNHNKISYVRKFSFIVREPKGEVWRTRVSVFKKWDLELLSHFADPRWTSVLEEWDCELVLKWYCKSGSEIKKASSVVSQSRCDVSHHHPVDFTENLRPVFQEANASLSLTPHMSWTAKGVNHSLFQGIFWTQGLNSGLLHCRQILYHLSHRGSLQRGWAWSKEGHWQDWLSTSFPSCFWFCSN